MTNEIIKSITEAEAQAAELKQQAMEKAAQILADAEARAYKQEQLSAEENKSYRDSEIKAATAEAEAEYRQTLSAKEKEAKEYCAQVLASSETAVNSIVGRVISGNR